MNKNKKITKIRNSSTEKYIEKLYKISNEINKEEKKQNKKENKKEKNQIDEKNINFSVIITNDKENRYGYSLNINWWDFRWYLKNSVVFWDHDSSINSIIGKCEKLEIRKNDILAKWTFTDLTELWRISNNLYNSWFLNAVSIGFIPTEIIEDEDWNLIINKWDLLEFSFVGAPANRDTVKKWKEKELDIINKNWIYQNKKTGICYMTLSSYFLLEENEQNNKIEKDTKKIKEDKEENKEENKEEENKGEENKGEEKDLFMTNFINEFKKEIKDFIKEELFNWLNWLNWLNWVNWLKKENKINNQIDADKKVEDLENSNKNKLEGSNIEGEEKILNSNRKKLQKTANILSSVLYELKNSKK